MEFLSFNGEGQTPVSADERIGLRLPVTTIGELDKVEQVNIEKAIFWLIGRRLTAKQVLSEVFIRKMHRMMFKDVWKWAGKFRQTEKNIGVRWVMIAREVKVLCDDVLFWIDKEVYPKEEIAIRFKHRLVSIHCFPNGNGRHSRMMADVLAEQVFQLPLFTWGRNLPDVSMQRTAYIRALRDADRGDVSYLVAFAK